MILMMTNKIQLKVAKRLRCGWKIFYEPEEREAYRHKCKHYHWALCKKGYYCFTFSDPRRRIIDTMRLGCTPNVECPILKRWDTRHGLKFRFHGVENYLEFLDWQL